MRTLYWVVLLGVALPALAQEVALAPQGAEGVEEVIVPGRRPQNLRVEIA